MDADDSLGFGFGEPAPTAPAETVAQTAPAPQQTENQMEREEVDVAKVVMDNKEEIIDAKTKCCNCFHKCTSVAWWQKFFDVDIKQFGTRCGYVFYFWSGKFLKSLGDRGDLWAPIWIPISLTIILTTCMLFTISTQAIIVDLNKIYGFLVAMVLYELIIPAILYFIIRCAGERHIIRMTQLWCMYGYSFIVYLPIGVLLLCPATINGSFQTMNAVIGCIWAVLMVFSVLFILFTLHNTLKLVFFTKAYWILTVVFGVLHAAMGVCVLMLVCLNGRI